MSIGLRGGSRSSHALCIVSILPTYMHTVTLWAVRMSALPPDDDHPYGHGRFEAVGSLGVSILLLITAWHIAAHAYDKLQHCLFLSSFPVITIPGWGWLGKSIFCYLVHCGS